MATILGSIVVQGTCTSSGQTFDGTLSGITGNNVMIFAMISSRGIGSSQSHNLYYEDLGTPMAVAVVRDQSLNGFAKGRSSISYKHIGNVVSKTETCRVQVNGGIGSNVEMACTFMAVAGLDNTTPSGTYNNGFSSAASSDSVVASSDFVATALTLGTWTASPTATGDVTARHNLGRSGAGGNDLRHASGHSVGTPTHSIGWSWSGASFIHVASGHAEVTLTPPVITSVNGGSSVDIVDTAIAVVGTDFVIGATDFWLADGTDFGTATKVEQSISSITTTTFDWDEVDLDGTLSPGGLYVFAVTNPGTGDEQISAAHAVTVTSPAAPVITNVDGGTTVDITDTNLTVNGTNLFTTGTTELWLADGTDFGTATKVLQTISSVTASSLNWDLVTPSSITPGARYLFVVSDAGGGGEQTSAAFAITLTEPPTAAITTVDGQTTGSLIVFDTETSLPVVGTDFNPGGTTELWLADSAVWSGSTKTQQTYSSLTGTTMTWDAITLGALSEGTLYLYVVTQEGTAMERVSGPYALDIYDVLAPVISAVDGGNTVNVVDTNLAVTGQHLSRPGTEKFWLADTNNFLTATKVEQSFTSLSNLGFTWPSINMGTIPFGLRYLFFQTDVGGSNEQTSGPFALNVEQSVGPITMTMIGDGEGMMFVPVPDTTPVEPDESVLVLRDHQAHTGLGKWWQSRDFLQLPTASGDIVLQGGLDGVWPATKSVRINRITASGTYQLVAEELLNIFTEAGREVFTAGFWLHRADLLSRGDVNNFSIFQIETAAPGYYLEIFVQVDSGDLKLGMAYDNGTRTTLFHTTRLADVSGDFVFVHAEWQQSAPYMRLRQAGVEVTSSAGTGPQAGLHEDSFIGHDFILAGGPNSPDLMVRLQGLFYGFGASSLSESNEMRDALTEIQYEVKLKQHLLHLLHYFRMDDHVPDRFLHNASEDLIPGELVGGTVQRGLTVAPYGDYYRITGGCKLVCPVADGAAFGDWDATITGHFRWLGSLGDTGNLFRLYNSVSGSSIELNKIAAGAGPNELNGMLQFIARDATGTPVVTHTITSPALDPFDGTFQSFAITTGVLGSDWVFSLGDVGFAYTQSLGVDVVPTWHASPYDKLEVGGFDMDVHSWAYLSSVDPTAHSSYHLGWTTLADLIQYAEDQGYDGFYWCDSPVVND